MMSPEIEDYLDLFAAHGGDLSNIYKDPNESRYANLFEQLVDLLIRPSMFNATLPEPFIECARRYRAGDEATVEHMQTGSNRHFMVCELFDYIELQHRVRPTATSDVRRSMLH